MSCKVCGDPADKGRRCTRCSAWYWRHGTERPTDYTPPERPERGLGKINCHACGEPIADHDMPPCPMYDGRASTPARSSR